jgi:hypothetical protein
MKKLRDDDYLLEITVRLSVRKENAAAVISLTERHDEDDEAEEDRILTSVLDLVDSGWLERDPLSAESHNSQTGAPCLVI